MTLLEIRRAKAVRFVEIPTIGRMMVRQITTTAAATTMVVNATNCRAEMTAENHVEKVMILVGTIRASGHTRRVVMVASRHTAPTMTEAAITTDPAITSTTPTTITMTIGITAIGMVTGDIPGAIILGVGIGAAAGEWAGALVSVR
jgi:hypothetical protein